MIGDNVAFGRDDESGAPAARRRNGHHRIVIPVDDFGCVKYPGASRGQLRDKRDQVNVFGCRLPSRRRIRRGGYIRRGFYFAYLLARDLKDGEPNIQVNGFLVFFYDFAGYFLVIFQGDFLDNNHQPQAGQNYGD